MNLQSIEKMLRAIANAQSSNKQELLREIKKVDSKVDNLGVETRKGFEKVNDRLDAQGKQLAYLEDDAPTRKEHENHEKRLKKLEAKAFA